MSETRRKQAGGDKAKITDHFSQGKKTQIDHIELMFYLITPKVFTAMKTPISHLKGHKICFLGKKSS